MNMHPPPPPINVLATALSLEHSSLLKFARNLGSTSRTLEGMGPEYLGNLYHVNSLKELNRKVYASKIA